MAGSGSESGEVLASRWPFGHFLTDDMHFAPDHWPGEGGSVPPVVTNWPVLVDILLRRGYGGVGHNPHRFVERFGGVMVPVLFYEPDANTARCDWYYNARLNQLFKRIKVKGAAPLYYWKVASEIS